MHFQKQSNLICSDIILTNVLISVFSNSQYEQLTSVVRYLWYQNVTFNESWTDLFVWNEQVINIADDDLSVCQYSCHFISHPTLSINHYNVVI